MSGARGRRVSLAEFRRMWSDPALRVDDIAAALGVSWQAVRSRARKRGLPPRRKPVALAIRDIGTFAAMWSAGVPTAAIMAHFACSHLTPRNTAARLGLQPRGRAWRAKTTLPAFLEDELGRRLAEAAARTGSAMLDRAAAERAAQRGDA